MMNIQQDRELAWARSLYQIGQSITREDTSKVQQQLLDHITSFFNASSGSIALLDADEDVLNIIAGSGSAAEFVGSTIPAGDGILGWVVRERKSLLLDGSISGDSRFRNMQPRPVIERPASSLCWPLTMDNQVIGTISVNRSPQSSPYNPEDREQGDILVNFISPVVANVRLYQEQLRRTEELDRSKKNLLEAQNQLLQSEKMASIGQLAAGVAHEINNPVGYISSNLGSLDRYLTDLFRLLAAYEDTESGMSRSDEREAVQAIKDEVKIEFLKEDISDLINESMEGITRVKQIVQDLKDFSHVDEAEWQWAGLHKGLDSTLNIVNHELRYKAEVVKEYGDLPQIECIASQLNQVFMNILVNAAHAIEEQGMITIRTSTEGNDMVCVEISDTGKGISPENLKRIFEPFYTTKPVGMGTGLGLSLSYGIIQKHGGRIDVASQLNKGTTFRILLPVQQREARAAS